MRQGKIKAGAIKGIRQKLKENRCGWHVHIDGKYGEYKNLTLTEILDGIPNNLYLTFAEGNVLIFEKKA